MRTVTIILLGLVALTCGHPVMTSGGDNGNELDQIARNGRQDAMLWTGSSDITAVIAPAGPLSAVAKPVGQAPTKAPVAPYKSKVVTPVKKNDNGPLNTRAPDGNQGSNAPAGLSSSGNSGSSPPRGPTGNNQGGQQGTKKNNSGGNNKKNNSNNKKNNKNKPNKDSSEEGSEESTEDGSSQESDENLESAEE